VSILKLHPIIGLALVLISRASSAQDYSEAVRQWPEMTLGITEKAPLSDVFDSGFRPYRWPGELGHMSIGFRHVRLTFVTRSGLQTPQMPMERCEIRVVGDTEQQILRMEFISPPLTLNEARIEMLKWLPFGQTTAQQMDEFLAKVKADWLHYEYEGTKRIGFATHWKDADGARYWISFMNARHWDTPLRLNVRVGQLPSVEGRPYESRRKPVEPPPGYESVDMELPSSGEWGPDGIYVAVTNEPRSPRGSLPPGVKLPKTFPDWDDLKKARAESAARDSSAKGTSAVPPQSSVSSPILSTPWSVIVILIVAAIGLLWALFKKRK